MPRSIRCLGLLVLAMFVPGANAQEKGSKGRDHVATCAKIEGALLERGKDGHVKVLKSGDPIPAKAVLLGFPKAELTSECKQVKIDLLLYLGDKLPLGAASVTLEDTAGLNADIALHHGVIGITNLAPKDKSVVRIHCADQTWTITLQDPGSSVVVARFGFHEPGVQALKTGKDQKLVDDPLTHVGVLVVKGNAVVDTGSFSYRMSAPPGPALITWDKVKGYDLQQLQALPEEVAKFRAGEDKLYKTIADTAAKLVTGDISKGLDQLVNSDNAEQRRIAVGSMGALGDLPRLLAALENTKYQDVREQAMRALWKWMSRDKGHLTKLYDFLLKDTKYTPVEDRGIILMLKGFDEDDRKNPAIYQLLIEAMDHRPLALREMAHWQLVKLVPAGASIAYDGAASEAARNAAVEQWRKLIPPGQLPPPPPLKKLDIKKGA
jgi:hypothetical protein